MLHKVVCQFLREALDLIFALAVLATGFVLLTFAFGMDWMPGAVAVGIAFLALHLFELVPLFLLVQYNSECAIPSDERSIVSERR